MPTDIEKTTAVINGLARNRFQPGSDEGTLDQYARDLANVHRGLYRLDDAEATTQAWLFAGGGTNANPSVFTIGTGLTLSINTSGATAVLATNPASTALPTHATKGSVRRLLGELGVAFTG